MFLLIQVENFNIHQKGEKIIAASQCWPWGARPCKKYLGIHSIVVHGEINSSTPPEAAMRAFAQVPVLSYAADAQNAASVSFSRDPRSAITRD